jgi:hypothetical protein
LKHWDGRTDDEKIRLELDEEAIQYIVRELTNLANRDGSWPSEGPRFVDWMVSTEIPRIRRGCGAKDRPLARRGQR